MLPAYEPAMATMDAALAAAERPVVAAAPHPVIQAIDLEGVRFTYPHAEQPAVDGVTLHPPAHTTTAGGGPGGVATPPPSGPSGM